MANASQKLLGEARRAHAASRWQDAATRFLEVDQESALSPADLEALAWSAAMCGRDRDMIAALERLYAHFMEESADEEAARVAFWIGLRLVNLGEKGRGSGWLQRSADRVAELGRESVYQGYLLLPRVYASRAGNDFDRAIAQAEQAVRIGRKFSNPDLIALAGSLLGDMLLRQGKIPEGFVPVDEAMLLVRGGNASPVVTGIVLCAVVASCFRIGDLARAREWTAVLSEWCDRQPQIGPFGGICMVHRAEIKRIECAWDQALREAQEAAERLEKTIERSATAAAHYVQGEIHRMRGNYPDAESKYAEASAFGLDPQPGLSRLRSAQRRREPALVALRRAVEATSDPLTHANLQFALVELLLEGGNTAEAASGCERLEEAARIYSTSAIKALAAEARGRFSAAAGDAVSAAEFLKTSFDIWSDTGAAFAAAQVRVTLATAYAALEDWDSVDLELAAAEKVFETVAAGPELAAIERIRAHRPKSPGGLTDREAEVLRYLAEGKTNREIAAELGLSAKTVNRHVENIFNKLGVSSRAAATAYAFKSGLL